MLDGEIVALDSRWRPDFSALQTRGGLTTSREIEAAARDTPVHLMVFDGDMEEAMATSRTLGLEGVVAKRRDAHHQEGIRSRDWITLTRHRLQEVVIVGWREGGLRGSVGALLTAIPGDDGLAYTGRVGTGLSDRERRGLLDRLAEHATDEPAVSD
ncbi:hypothetical protein [Rathayibacter rathayi]|uniref:ATP dependent DNA ligase n=1 Tax=Rathayibacter rathayi TaxID=33887 RepID=UPI00215811B4|nr:hypothetical protein [Rathayibacter rathayi]